MPHPISLPSSCWRRMHRVGLDPERITWIPLTAGHTEHLEQYQQVDIALDPAQRRDVRLPVKLFGWVRPLLQKQGVLM